MTMVFLALQTSPTVLVLLGASEVILPQVWNNVKQHIWCCCFPLRFSCAPGNLRRHNVRKPLLYTSEFLVVGILLYPKPPLFMVTLLRTTRWALSSSLQMG